MGFRYAAWFFSDMSNPVGFIPAGKLDGYHFEYTSLTGQRRLKYYPDTTGTSYDTASNAWSNSTGHYDTPAGPVHYSPFDAVNLNPELARQGAVTFLLVAAAPVVRAPVAQQRPATVKMYRCPDPSSWFNYLFANRWFLSCVDLPCPISLWTTMSAKFASMTMSPYTVSAMVAEANIQLLAYPHWKGLVERLAGDPSCPHAAAFAQYPVYLAHAVIYEQSRLFARAQIHTQKVAIPAAQSATQELS